VSLNLPNAITAARIASTPLIAALVISAGWQLRLTAWCLFIIAAVTDYFDGKLARDRNLVTNLGKLLDPLADKMLLLATLVPMYWLTRDVALWASLPKPDAWAAGATIGPVLAGARVAYPFVTPLGLVGLPFWIIAVVLVIAGIIALTRKQMLQGVALIVVGLLIGPGGVSVFSRRR